MLANTVVSCVVEVTLERVTTVIGKIILTAQAIRHNVMSFTNHLSPNLYSTPPRCEFSDWKEMKLTHLTIAKLPEKLFPQKYSISLTQLPGEEGEEHTQKAAQQTKNKSLIKLIKVN